jgi:thiamine biosynthesis protein ThiS
MIQDQHFNTETWILINGEVYVINYPIHLVNLFEFIGDKKPGLITEYNQIIVKPEVSKKIILNNLDRIEFVTIVGGG